MNSLVSRAASVARRRRQLDVHSPSPSPVARNAVARAQRAARVARIMELRRARASPSPQRSMRVILNELENRETEEGRQRTLEEMLQNDIIDVGRREVAQSLKNIKQIHGKKALTDEMTVAALHAVLTKLKRLENPAAGRSGRRTKGRRTKGRRTKGRRTKGRRSRGRRSRGRR